MEKLRRSSGVLLHITSLPNKYGLGTFSSACYDFINFLARGGFTTWQVLPFAECGYGLSPYSAISSFAINKYLIDLTEFLSEEEMNSFGFDKSNNSSNEKLYEEECKFDKALDLVYSKFSSKFDRAKFNKDNSYWIDDYAIFRVCQKLYGLEWINWPYVIKSKSKTEIAKIQTKYSLDIDKEKFFQYIADYQWKKIMKYAKENNIKIFGDIPMYVELNSADVWSNQKDWQIVDGVCKCVAGVPGDYFNPEGQLWGYPLYDYTNMTKNKFTFWKNRMKRVSELFDIIRIDHFIAFNKYYSIPFGKSANEGKWVIGAREKVLNVVTKASKDTLVAEDLGVITDDVIKLKNKYNMPGLKVLQFAFDENNSNHQPHNYDKNCVAYLGTHDNDTFMGFLNSCDWDRLNRFKNYVGIPLEWGNDGLMDKSIECLYRSSANLIILTMQDILKLGSECRMNIPGKPEGNWQWQLENIDMSLTERYRYLSEIFGRI